MKVVIDYPPNIEDIRAVFPLHKGVFFAYGDILYNPDNAPFDRFLLVHEQTHKEQQERIGVAEWWNLYLHNTQFRFEQEVEAYRNQWRVVKSHGKDRNKLEDYLRQIATSLASPLYGSMVTYSEARGIITAR